MTIGIKFPFTITNGSVAASTNVSEVIGSRVTFCLGTMLGERVMRPNWGVDIINTVHAVGGDLDEAIPEAIENAFTEWFSDYEAREINIVRRSQNPTWIDIEVRFGRYDSELDTVIRFGTQLADGTEVYTNEGF